MKKLRVTVGGTTYDVEVEVVDDDDDGGGVGGDGFERSPASAPVVARSGPKGTARPAKPKGGGGAPAPAADLGVLEAPIAGVVAKLTVGQGDPVAKGDTVVVLEAMKMFTNISSPTDGKVQAIRIGAGDAVQQGQVLMEFA